MSRDQKIRLAGLIMVILALFFAAMSISGCTAAQREEAENARSDAAILVKSFEESLQVLRSELEQTPEGTERHAEILARVERAEKLLAQAQQVVHGSESLIDSFEDGELDPEARKAVTVLPYGELIWAGLASVFAGWKAWQSQQRAKELSRKNADLKVKRQAVLDFVQTIEDVQQHRPSIANVVKKRAKEVYKPETKNEVEKAKSSVVSNRET